MKIAELIELLEKIQRERTLEAHHDMLFQSYPDIEALERVISLLKFLDTKKPDDKVSIAELKSIFTA